MTYNHINHDDVFLILKKEVNSIETRHILLNRLISAVESVNHDLPAFLQSPKGQAAFIDAVFKLVAEQVITPVGKPNTVQGLHQKYRKTRRLEEKDQGLMTQIVRNIAPPATLDYYLKNPQDYLNDSAIIEVISDFLKQDHKDLVTVNERAYQLFGDEKFFKGAGKNRSRGDTVLKRLGLNYASIACVETAEPFFSFQNKDFHALVSRNIFIVENKDTFWSFKRNIMNSSSRIKVDMLIYGEGKKIISSFKFVNEYGVSPLSDRFFYFGDLDLEGINIYCELLDQYPQYEISPFDEGYQAVLEIGLKKEPVKTPKKQKIKKENIARFIQAFEHAWAAKMKKHLEGGFYVPQEALSATEMKERFGSITND